MIVSLPSLSNVFFKTLSLLGQIHFPSSTVGVSCWLLLGSEGIIGRQRPHSVLNCCAKPFFTSLLIVFQNNNYSIILLLRSSKPFFNLLRVLCKATLLIKETLFRNNDRLSRLASCSSTRSSKYTTDEGEPTTCTIQKALASSDRQNTERGQDINRDLDDRNERPKRQLLRRIKCKTQF